MVSINAPWAKALVLGLLGASVAGCGGAAQVVKVITQGDGRTLRKRAEGEAPNSPSRPPLLILALDGVGRDLLYSMLRHGDLPELALLLGREGNDFPHAYFAPRVVTTLPSTTGVAWATIFTGVPAANHGFMGNEFFVREKRAFAAPIPVSVKAAANALAVFTEGYVDQFLMAPTVYETMRARDPAIDIWVSMSQFYRGADRLLLTRRGVLVSALEAFVTGHTDKDLPRKVWQDLDEEDVEVVVENLRQGPLPDVLTLYLFGTDDWAHIAPEGPDVARRKYLTEILDPAIGTLRRRLEERHALDDRYVVVVSDHGHTAVPKDDAHALATEDEGDPPEVLTKAGYKVRPFEGDVSESDPFQSVLAYEGAIAYVYVADRSTCANGDVPCDWTRPPRYEEDVLPVAEAFFRNNQDGSLSPAMKGSLDLVLTRRPVPVEQEDRPFEVYVGGGRTETMESYLARHPHPSYVDVAPRLRALAVGPHGERAGDVLLLAHNGDRKETAGRYYFATPYHSWHGSPSQQDSVIPFIVANPRKSAAELGERVRALMKEESNAQGVGAVLVGLREGAGGTKVPTK
jgi:hypothetical protein